MKPSSHRRLLQEQMQQATIKRRLAHAAAKRAVGKQFAGLQSFVRDLLEGVAVEVEVEPPQAEAAPQADGPVRH